MVVFRIEREKYLSNTLSGIGASMSNAFRWNSLYTRLVYSAESRALAMLEVSVHLDFTEDLPRDRYCVEIEIPDHIDIQEVSLEDLPKDWNAKPPGKATQAIGDDFVLLSAAAVLKAPSAIIPQEYNYLINPHHPAAQKIKVIKATQLDFDSRFGRS